MRLARFAFATAVLMSLSTAQIAAAQTNPILDHYRAYSAALARGDLPTATSEAEAALAASEARDGDGGRTAVLALNLATVQLMAGRAEQALGPAQRALTLARGGAQGVDPALVEVMVLRAMLALDRGPDVAAQLNTLLASPAGQALSDDEIYVAASQLGNWGFAHENYALAQHGWEMAGARAAGSPFGEAYGLGRARTSEGIAIILSELKRGRVRIDEDEGIEAHALLSEGVRVLYPLSQIESPRLELTVAQQTYSEARAWLMALETKLDGDGWRVPVAPAEAQGDADGFSEIGPVDLTRPRCMMRMIAEPRPRYPGDNSQVGAVMIFFRVDARGQIASHQIVARAGSDAFAQSIERVIDGWRVERVDEGSAPNCRMEASILQGVRFVLPN